MTKNSRSCFALQYGSAHLKFAKYFPKIMANKEDFCYSILKKYSLIVDFEGTPANKTVPPPLEDETFSKWKKRVLGSNVTDVLIYGPYAPSPNKRISSLQNEASAEHLKKVFRSFNKTKKTQKDNAVNNAIDETERQFLYFSKETLQLIIDELDEELEPSVQQFFDRFLKQAEPDINTEDLLRSLLQTYNTAVRLYRQR